MNICRIRNVLKRLPNFVSPNASYPIANFTSCCNNFIYTQDDKFVQNIAQLKIYANYTTRVIEPEDGLIKKVLKKVGFSNTSKSRIKVTSCILYESVADKINYLEFFEQFSMPNTFNSWFLVTELHVWMLLVRSMAEGSESGEDGRALRNNIVEAMWIDVNTRAKKLGAGNPSRTRAQIEILSEQFQAALISYDEGIMSNDKVLAAALWRRFFEKRNTDYTKLEKLVIYVRKQINMLDGLQPPDFIVKPKINWINLNKV